MDRDSFIVQIKSDDIYVDIVKNVEMRFHISNEKLHKPLPRGENEKVIGLMKNELDRKTMTKFVPLRPKTDF